MAILLNIETATKNCSVSLSEGDRTLALKEIAEEKFSHAEKLHSFVKQVLRDAGMKWADLDAVAVSKGPGSYTGLRIGVSTCKGLCYAKDLPLISVPTLESLARRVSQECKYIVPLLDARRMEVYTAVFDADFQVLEATSAKVLEEDSFKEFLEEGKVVFLGDGAEKASTLISHPNAVFLKDQLPSAREMAVISAKKFAESDFEDLAYFEPYYLKDFIAGKPKKYF